MFLLASLACSQLSAQTFTLETGWPQADGIVHAMALDEGNGILYLGGDFTQVDGQSRERLAAVEINTGTLTSWAPSANAAVRTISVAGDSVIIGGDFSMVNSTARTNLAAVSKSTSALLSWAPVLNEKVFASLVNGNTVHIGGSFTSANGQVRDRLCAFDAVTGGLTAWDPDASSLVNTMILNGSSILIGGAFNQVGGQSRLRVAELDPVSGAPNALVVNADATVNGLLVSGNSLLVGGLFNSLAGQPRTGVARVSSVDGSLDGWAPSISLQARCFAMAGQAVVVGGFFSTVNGSPHTNLAVLDPSTGSLLVGSPSASSTVNAMIAFDGKLYVGGAFVAVNGGQARSRFAVFSYCTSQPWFADADEDGFGDNGAMTMACDAPPGHVADNTDCDDNDDNIGAPTTWYVDLDGDENGDPFNTIIACEQPLGTSEDGTDCDDGDPMIAQGEPCDDNDPYTVNDVLQPYPACGCIGRQVIVSASVLLEGAFDPLSGLMRDDLRVAGLVPLVEPYTAMGFLPAMSPPFPSIAGGDMTTAAVLAVTGPDAIVDWVVLELRSIENSNASRLNTRFALVQRDGDIVEPDGMSPVRFPIPPAQYRLSVLHRNHIGVMEAWGALQNGSYYENEIRDFTSSMFDTEGAGARVQAGSLMLLRAGDTTFNDEVSYVGADNDRDPMLAYIGGTTPTNTVANVYTNFDVNMDGTVKYTGQENDRDLILQTIGGSVPTAVRAHVYRFPTY